MRQKLFLVGMPGVGKSYWGRRLSDAYGVRFVDLDEQVQVRAGKTIEDIFASDGETSFREYERNCLLDVIASEPHDMIVACGGGTPCFYDNMKLMLDAGVVVYLETDVSQLLRNLIKDVGNRPLIDMDTLNEETLSALLSMRNEVYRQAHHILHVKDISISTFGKIFGDV